MEAVGQRSEDRGGQHVDDHEDEGEPSPLRVVET